MKIFIVLIFFISSLIANDINPGLFTWFSASELSFAGGSSLSLAPNSRNVNLAETTDDKSFSTSYVFYPAGIQAQSASLLLSINNKVIIGSINHISYGTFNGYDENAIQTDNYTSSDTWVRLGYTEAFNKLPLRFGMSNQVYFSKLENYKSIFLYSSFGLVWEIEKYKLEVGIMINDFLLIHNDSKGSINNAPDFNIGFCKELIHLPLKMSMDFRTNAYLDFEDCYISGEFKFSDIFSFNVGTSTRKFSQNTEQSLSQTIFGSSGLGINYKNKELIIGYGLYFYGVGGFSNGFDLTIKF
tara:strand:+ start:204 stop:1100 length:897 start_codon:yes stop_codon:yes gene_type:complete